MHPPDGDSPPKNEAPSACDWPASPAIEAHEPRNLILLAVHQVIFRVGWMFKTESVIVPAFLDYVAGPGAGGLRGCLPVLNRVGQSILPVLVADRLRRTPQKKLALAGITMLLSLPLAVVAAVQFHLGGQRWAWMPILFLAMYFVFSSIYGLYQLAFGTVQGKLIRPTRRGHLLSVSTFWGTIPAVAVTLWLMPRWLEARPPDYASVFTSAAVCLVLAGATAACLFEKGHGSGASAAQPREGLRVMIDTLRRDPGLRRLILVSMLFSVALMTFPHYQAMAREKLGLGGAQHVLWIVTQSVSVGVYSLFVGRLADARGNRLTLRLLIFGSAIAPAFALAIVYLPPALGTALFWLTFIPLGLTPLVTPMLLNYALEMCDPAEHPRYLSTVNLGMTVPFVFSPFFGKLVDLVGFEIVFVATVCLIVAAGWMTFALDEPRGHARREKPREVVPRAEE